MKDLFHKMAQKVSAAVGSPVSFFLAIFVIAVWAITGPMFGYSDTWQLVINTGTTIITFLMVFLIQNTQNRDARVIHLKLDELIRASAPARNSLLDLEDLSDEEIEKLEKEFKTLRDQIQVIKEVKQKGKRGKRPREGGSALGKSPLTSPGV
ncbi:MAG TPA: low affinity iron permease family protein [Fibrobacteria bacterium]|nr:low affinity iron permease family protein [Fibrobacteria bacterium]